MVNTKVLKNTPDYARGVASTLLKGKCASVDDIVRANAHAPSAHHSAEHSLAKWLTVLLGDSSEYEASVVQYLSQAWHIP